MTKLNPIIVSGLEKRRRRYALVVGVLILLIVFLAYLIMTYGNTIYSLDTVFRVLQGEQIKGATFTIKTLRLPTLMVGILAGFAFGMAGNTFQTLLRNDLASPDIIGVTSGSSAAAVFCILVLKMSGISVSLVALVVGLIVSAFIYGLSQGSKGRLILIGIGMQAMLNAFISYILLRSAQYDVATALRWLNGSLNGVQMVQVPALLVTVVGIGLILVVLSRHLQVLQLGDASATTLGINLHLTYFGLIVSTVLLVAFATSVSGPIASIAFLSGPIAARLVGKSQVNTLPAGLIGVVLVLASYFVGQFAFASRYPVGVITGVLGAPYMLFLLIQMNRKGEGTV